MDSKSILEEMSKIQFEHCNNCDRTRETISPDRCEKCKYGKRLKELYEQFLEAK